MGGKGKRDALEGELRILKALGILLFKKCILTLERMIHQKDGGRNRNYHPSSLTKKGIERYKWYLVYNSLLHCMSIAMTFVLFAVVAIRKEEHAVIYVVLGILLMLFNIWCLLLQRYNYVKLRLLLVRRQEARERKFGEDCKKIDAMKTIRLPSDSYNRGTLLLTQIENVFKQRKCFTVTEYHYDLLRDFADFLSEAGIAPAPLRGEACPDLVKGGDTLEAQLNRAEPVTKVDVLVGLIRRVFDRYGLERENRRTVLLLDAGPCERLYRRVFGFGSAEQVLYRVELLRYLYNHRIKVVRKLGG